MSTQQQIVGADILLEFLEVAFHNILYVRNLYPKEIFVRKQIYGIATQVSEHPELNTYLKEVLNSIRELIRHDENSVRKITLCFYNQEKTPVEQFVFDLGKLKADLAVQDPFFLKTEEALRTFCLKLSTSGSYLKRLPENATFSIQIQTHEAAHAALNENPKCENFPWIEAEEGTTEIKEQTLLPLKSINTEYLNLQMYALEKERRECHLNIQTEISPNEIDGLCCGLGQIDNETHILYQTILIITPQPLNQDWHVFEGLQPTDKATTFPSENLLSWQRRDSLTADQRHAVEQVASQVGIIMLLIFPSHCDCLKKIYTIASKIPITRLHHFSHSP